MTCTTDPVAAVHPAGRDALGTSWPISFECGDARLSKSKPMTPNLTLRRRGDAQEAKGVI